MLLSESHLNGSVNSCKNSVKNIPFSIMLILRSRSLVFGTSAEISRSDLLLSPPPSVYVYAVCSEGRKSLCMFLCTVRDAVSGRAGGLGSIRRMRMRSRLSNYVTPTNKMAAAWKQAVRVVRLGSRPPSKLQWAR